MRVLQRAAAGVARRLGRDSTVVRHARPVYERLLAALAGDRGIPWTINGAEFRISPFYRQRMGSIYDPEVAAYLSKHVRPGSVCLDVGANVGVYVLQCARWTGPRGRVVAFEPNPVSADALAGHVRMNGYDGYVQIVRAAIADRQGTQTFHMAGADGMSRLGAPNPKIDALTTAVTVPVTTIDAFCGEHALRPDWLLIDVEGFEFAALSGARETLASLGGTLGIIVEMHPDAWSVAGWDRRSAEALLDELRLEAVSFAGARDPLGAYGHVLLKPRGSDA